MSNIAHAQTCRGVSYMHLIKYKPGVENYINYYYIIMKTTYLPKIFQIGL